MATKANLIAMSAPVEITAGEAQGDKPGPAKFTATFYTGGALSIDGWDLPVVVDLAGLENGKVLVANLDHDRTKRVGNFAVANDGKSLVANGTATAHTPARDEVVQSALDGYQWQSSLEVNPKEVEEIKAGKTVEVNGQSFTGPLYVTRKGTLKGFGFVSHGADDNTTASIAASAASTKEIAMKAEVKTWIESRFPSVDINAMTPDEAANWEADYEGRDGLRKRPVITASSPFEEHRLEAKRIDEITAIAKKRLEDLKAASGGQLSQKTIDAMDKMLTHAKDTGMTVQEFRCELVESTYPMAHTVHAPARGHELTDDVLIAALCQSGGLSSVDEHFAPEVNQAAHDRYKGRLGIGQFIIEAAEAKTGQRFYGREVTLDMQRAAFGMANGPHPQIQAFGFSGIDVANIVAATANKFLHEGWMHVDMTPLRIAAIRSVRNFQQITTVSLTGHLQYEKVGPAGEIKDGVLDDLTYTNQVDTYGLKLGITRQDLINDDLSALTAVPRRLGRGGALKLNDIFWTEFLGLVSSNFFSSGNSNINTGVADMTVGGLDATETIFMNQTDPDGKPVGFTPKILLVPTALKNKAAVLMGSMGSGVAITAYATATGDANPFVGRFRVESSPYISNSSYTGYTSQAWWMLADPNDAAVIEIAALNGKVEPTIETVNAPFGYLGIGMQGYSDIGVNEQEKRAGVHADGNAS